MSGCCSPEPVSNALRIAVLNTRIYADGHRLALHDDHGPTSHKEQASAASVRINILAISLPVLFTSARNEVLRLRALLRVCVMKSECWLLTSSRNKVKDRYACRTWANIQTSGIVTFTKNHQKPFNATDAELEICRTEGPL